MVWLAVDKNGDEGVHDMKPTRNNEYMWWSAWEDEPVEFTEVVE
jgi:hypothetical protein